MVCSCTGRVPGVAAGGVVAGAAGVGLIIWRLGRGLGCWVFAGTDQKPGQKVMPCRRGCQGLVDGGLSPVQPVHGAPRNQNRSNLSPSCPGGALLGRGWWGHRGGGHHGKTGASGAIHPRHTAPWQRGCYATPIRLLLLALEVCVNARPCWRNVPLPFWRDKLGYRVLEKWLSCWGWGVLGRVSWVEQAPYLADMERGTEGILVAQAGGEGK